MHGTLLRRVPSESGRASFRIRCGRLLSRLFDVAAHFGHSFALSPADAGRHGSRSNSVTSNMSQVMEDVWLGSLLYRFPPAEPIRFVTLSELNARTLVSDEWGLHVSRTALLVHLRAKHPARMLALHEFMTGADGSGTSGHCTCLTRLACHGGCRGFLSDGERDEEALTRALRGFGRARPTRVPKAWLSRSATSATISAGSNRFCHGNQVTASFCKLEAELPRGWRRRTRRPPCCTCCSTEGCAWRNVTQAPIDLMPRARQLQARMRLLLNGSAAYVYFKAASHHRAKGA